MSTFHQAVDIRVFLFSISMNYAQLAEHYRLTTENTNIRP